MDQKGGSLISIPVETSMAALPDSVNYRGFAYPGSVVVLPSGKLLTVCTGHRQDAPCYAVGMYSADGGRTWAAPCVLFGGDQLSASTSDLNESYADPNLVIVNNRRVMVFCVSLRYDKKVWDLSRTRFWRRISDDCGETFGPVEELPRHKKYYVGTVHPGMRLQNGTLVVVFGQVDRSDPASRFTIRCVRFSRTALTA